MRSNPNILAFGFAYETVTHLAQIVFYAEISKPICHSTLKLSFQTT